jgi:GntR family transcriptional repressor for pyruvate dehydrogenase complex
MGPTATEPRIGDRRRLSSVVAQEISSWIIDGKLKAGDSLPSEADMCAQFNVSKPTLREAIDKLSVMGIVKVQQGKQTTVNPLNSQVLEGFFRYAVRLYPEGLYDMLELRRGLETEAAALAAQRGTQDEGDRLIELSHRMRQVRFSPAEYLSADYEFHLQLAEMSRNKLILQTFHGISEHVRYSQRISHRQRDIWKSEEVLQVHHDLALAVSGHDPVRTRQLMFDHFENMMPYAAAIIADKSRQADIF